MEECVFCHRKNFEERLIGETDSFWVIATLGQIKQGGYSLLVSKRHAPCIGALTEEEIKDFCSALDKICFASGYATSDPRITIFEHGVAGQSIKHAHLHIVPLKCDITSRVLPDFIYSDFSVFPIHPSSWFFFCQKYNERAMPYLLWKDSGVGIKVCRGIINIPQQYLRTLVFKDIGQPELANWRNVDLDEDKERWEETVKKLKPRF